MWYTESRRTTLHTGGLYHIPPCHVNRKGGSGVEIQETFEEIYTAYQERIYRFLYRLCSDRDVAEELTQETFYRAFQSFSRYKGNSTLFTWLASIAKHTYYTYLRRNRRMIDSISLESALEFYCAEEESGRLLGEQQEQELYVVMRDWIAALPEKYRDVILLRIYADMSFKQVAETMNITENSAKVLFFRAKTMLKERLTNELEM